MANQPKKYKKFVATAATATLVASAIVPVASAASLSDIAGNTHEEAINALVDAKVISGYPDGTFKPNKTLTRSDVVKLLGKYLVSQGHSIPTDAVSNPRFSDLTSKSNKELLEYAAVVADAGVFAGSNGKLLAGDQITRENMAIVLVRMINTLKDVSLEEFVASQNFNGDVKDLNVAKAEARTAIQVLDFYDITNPSVANFNPKGNTTRGQFATFLHKTINSDFAGAAATTGTVKAINATTVEVTFGEEVADIKALDFKIEGLEVKNAVVKQTDKKTVVLTTATQTAAKEYTVTVNGNAVGKFVGVSAVIPTAIKVTTPSVQGTIGKEVTVSAEVTVPDGQSKAGIPVTFNIVNDNANLNNKIEVVAYTNESGVASYSYTRYYKNNDNFTAYATDKSSVFASGKVFWAESLTIKEVTQGNTLSNGSKKVYEISSPEHKNGYVNVTFKENVQVTPDKLVSSVTITDAPVYVKNSNGTLSLASNKYPYEVTTGGVQLALVKLDANGKATFTVEGSNATVTPVVFVDGTYITENNLTKWTGDGKLDAQELQVTAPSVKFELNHTLGLTVQAQGVQNAASWTGKGEGGRDYQVTFTDKDGKVAPAGSNVKVVFPEGSISKDKAVYITYKNSAGTTIKNEQVQAGKIYDIYVTGSKGQVSFKLTGAKDAFATPTVYVENGTDRTKLDKNDLQTVSETTYFVDAVVNSSKLTTYSSVDTTEETTTIAKGEKALFVYESVDQNGFPYYADNGNYEVTFQVSPQFANVNVSGNQLVSKTIQKGTTESVKVVAVNGKATLTVDSIEDVIGSNVTVSASSSQVTLEDKPATVFFAKYSSTVKTGVATNVDTGSADELTIDGVLYTYAGANYKYQGSTITKAAFEGYIANNTATVSVTKDDEGKLTFDVLSVGATPGATLDAINVAIESKSATQLKLALRGISKFAALSDADQTTVAAAINTTRNGSAFASTAALDTALDTEIAAVKQTAFEASVKGVVDTAKASDATFAKLLTAVEKVAGAEASVTALNAVNGDALKVEVVRVVAGLTATAIDTNATTFNTAITNAISTATTNVGNQAVTDALKEVTDALADVAAALAVPATPTAEEYKAVLDALSDNSSLLGLTLADFNALSATEKEDVIDGLSQLTINTPAQLNAGIQSEVKAVIPAVITEASLSGTTLTLTFSKAVSLDGTFDSGVLNFKQESGATGTTAVSGATISTGKLVLTVTDAVADGLAAGATITGLSLVESNGTTAVTVEDADSLVVTSFGIKVVTP